MIGRDHAPIMESRVTPRVTPRKSQGTRSGREQLLSIAWHGRVVLCMEARGGRDETWCESEQQSRECSAPASCCKTCACKAEACAKMESDSECILAKSIAYSASAAHTSALPLAGRSPRHWAGLANHSEGRHSQLEDRHGYLEDMHTFKTCTPGIP